MLESTANALELFRINLGWRDGWPPATRSTSGSPARPRAVADLGCGQGYSAIATVEQLPIDNELFRFYRLVP
jgi:ubiquinone/menaquinone biosynthesis C-methylase UbiE